MGIIKLKENNRMKTKIVTVMLTLFLASIMVFNVTPVSAATIDVDGSPSDWDGIDPIITDSTDYYLQLDIKEVYITADEDNIYFRIDVYGSIGTRGNYRFVIDTDQNPETGMSFYGIGADFYVGFYHPGLGWRVRLADMNYLAILFAYSGSTLELSVARDDLGNPTGFDFIVFCNPSDSVYPSIPVDFYTVVDDQVIAVDGDAGDWDGIPYLTDVSGDAVSPSLDLGECYVGSNGVDLFVMMKTTTSVSIDPSAYINVGIRFVDEKDIWHHYFLTGFVEVGWTVWEGSVPLLDINRGVGDQIYVSFFLMSYAGDLTSKGTWTETLELTRLVDAFLVDGSIDNEGVAETLFRRLNQAQAMIDRGNVKPVEKILFTFIRYVEAQLGKHITETAAQTLIDNTQALIDIL